jgi:hypothetical protein
LQSRGLTIVQAALRERRQNRPRCYARRGCGEPGRVEQRLRVRPLPHLATAR